MSSVIPKVTIREQKVFIENSNGMSIEVEQHQRYGVWTFMALIEMEKGGLVAIFEDFSKEGTLVYLDAQGNVLMKLSKRMESTYNDEQSCYLGYDKNVVVNTTADLLGQKILAADKDPEYDEIAAVLPPIRDVISWGATGEAPHTFIGTKESADAIPLYYSIRNAAARINHNYVSSEIEKAIKEHTVSEGLVGGWLPVVLMHYPVDESTAWEVIAFAKTHSHTTFKQPAWYRYTKLVNGEIKEIHYYDSYLPYPLNEEPDERLFYADLHHLKHYWEAQLGGGMDLQITAEQWVADFCKHSMVNDIISRADLHPRYGMVIKYYGSHEHDGFQDLLTASVDAYLEWGKTEKAKEYLVNYFDQFVRDNGQIEYRGPELGQYGCMLTGIAKYYDYTHDTSFVDRFEKKIDAITDILFQRRSQAKQLPKDEPAYGMISGRHEADMSFEHRDFLNYDFEQPYFSNSTQTWRGFRDLGRMWVDIGSRRKDEALIAKGNTLIQESELLAVDIFNALETSLLYDRGGAFLPPIAGSKLYYYDYPYRTVPDSFDDNRVWCEMMYSGIVPKKFVDIILKDAAVHNGMRMGIFGNRKLAVAFLCYGEGYGLIQHDMVREFLLFYYSHALHMHTRGTWTAFECVDIDRDRALFTGFCPPAQMTIPTVTKWMLVFEEPLNGELWLCKTTPKKWLSDGEGIVVKDAPTRFGKVSMELESHINNGYVNVLVDIPKGNQNTIIRLRMPGDVKIQEVLLNGQKTDQVIIEGEDIRLSKELTGSVQLYVRVS